MISHSNNGRVVSIFLIVLGGCFVLCYFVILAVFLNVYSQLQRYQAGHCTITAKQLIQQEVTQTQTQTSNGHTTTTTTMTTEYKPNFQFTVQTANGQSYPAQGYDALNSGSSDQASQQAIVDQYTVGNTYPCWYDPANPSQAVLTRQFSGLVFLIPGLFLIAGGVLIIIGIIIKRSKIKNWSRTEFSNRPLKGRRMS